ncbi:MAG: T9SS type A sorting domain-containing protein [Bacteroidetes bacterium]|nr:T9SS type A sorting domain-containing protein [Bacteroidota bacterium]
MKKYFYSLITFIIVLLHSQTSVAQSETLDNTFGDEGIVEFEESAINTDGMSLSFKDDKIYFAFCSDNKAFVVRLLIDGSYDPEFGIDGVQEILLNDSITFSHKIRMEIQDDNKIMLVAGTSSPISGVDFCILRLLDNGLIDSTFNNVGYFIFDNEGLTDYPRDILIQPDEKILVSGYSYFGSSDLVFRHLILVRFLPNGTLDSTFNDIGILESDILDRGNFIALQSDGKIIACDGGIHAKRFNSNGDYDNSFEISITGPWGGYSHSLWVNEFDTIFIGGDSNHGPTVYKFLPDGNLYTDFGEEGKSEIPGDFLTHIHSENAASDSNGNIFTVGYHDSDYASDNDHLVIDLAKISMHGVADSTFSEDAHTVLNLSYDIWPLDIVVQPDDKVVIAGMRSTWDGWKPICIRYDNLNTYVATESTFQDFSFYPVPANNFVTINFPLEKESELKISIYDLQGKRIQVIENHLKLNAGSHSITYNIPNYIQDGNYLFEILLNGEPSMRKLVPIIKHN